MGTELAVQLCRPQELTGVSQREREGEYTNFFYSAIKQLAGLAAIQRLAKMQTVSAGD